MIVRPKPKVWELLGIWRLSILERIAPQIVAVLVWSAAVVWLERRATVAFRSWSVAPFTLLGVALSIFLGFRNSACYERWWEARRQLGALAGEVRSYARVCVALQGGDRERRRRMVQCAIAYTYALMSHLRGEALPNEVERYAPGAREGGMLQDVPDALLRRMSAECAAMLAEGEIGEPLYKLLEERVVALAGIQVACERIRGTPTPFTYTLLIHRTAYAYCFLLPFGLVSTMGWATPVFAALVAYAFFGLDALGDELEEPFGEHPNALAMSALARTVEINLLEALGEAELPEPLRPVRSVLR